MISWEDLKQVCFFQDLAVEHLKRIAQIAEIREIPPGAIVFREGDASPYVYIVQDSC